MIEDRIRTLEREHFARHRVTWSERFLDVDAGVRIRVLELGNGAPIICLHAASWFAAHWAELSASLPGHRLCCLDMPGHGLSDAVVYSVRDVRAQQVRLFRRILEQLGLGRTRIMGNSFGGMTALWLALDASELVSEVVILGVPATALPGAKPDLLMSLLTIRGFNRLLLALPSTQWSSRLILRGALGRPALARLPAELVALHALGRKRRAFTRTIASWMPATHAWRRGLGSVTLADEELAALGQPVHFIWGAEDPFGGPVLAERAATRLASATVTVIPGGHFPQLGESVRCARAIADALQ